MIVTLKYLKQACLAHQEGREPSPPPPLQPAAGLTPFTKWP